jgi:hypothetical protein
LARLDVALRRAAKFIDGELIIYSQRRMIFRGITIRSQECIAPSLRNFARMNGRTIEKQAPRGAFANLQRGA